MTDLLEQYVPRVFRFALRLTNDHHAAEDLTQESMLRAWKHRDRLRDPQRSLVWLFRIVSNVWRDQVRRCRHPAGKTSPLEVDLVGNAVTPDSLLAREDEVRRALDAMQSLPARQRQVLHLHACEGMEYEDIAEVLAISIASVKANLSLARKRMRELLSDVIQPPVPRPRATMNRCSNTETDNEAATRATATDEPNV